MIFPKQVLCLTPGAKAVEADAAAKHAAEMRASEADKELASLRTALKEESESHVHSKNLIARLEREANQFASQQESMVVEHQHVCTQLEDHIKALESKVCNPLFEGNQLKYCEVIKGSISLMLN